MAEEDINQFMRLRNQQVITAENLVTGKNLSPVVIPKLSKGMDEQLKPAHKVDDVVDRTNKKIRATLLRHKVDKLESSCTQMRLFALKREDEKFQQIVNMKYKLDSSTNLM